MAESLIAILLVTNSAKGANLVFRWPPFPVSSPRLCRAKPDSALLPSQLDNPWRASHYHQESSRVDELANHDYGTDPEYLWQRPNASPSISSFSPVNSAAPRNNSPSKGRSEPSSMSKNYDYLFGYSVEFLASLLSPQKSMCHQKFELIVDDLAFIGHPVRADDVGWRFKPEKLKTGPRGRESRDVKSSDSLNIDETASVSPDRSTEVPSGGGSSWIHAFQLAFVLDLPDPSSSASGNIFKYFDLIYEQIVFTLTAVLFQEQVLSNFVETECDILSSLRESSISKDELYETFVSNALQLSSVASAMKSVYEAIKSRSVAYVTLNAIPLELQLPPFLDNLLHSEGDHDIGSMEQPEDEELRNWGHELSFGWQLPALAPWKSLLLHDGENESDHFMSLQGPHFSAEDRTLAEGLVRFLEAASVTLSLADMSSQLDWDLETQVYPVVRWLVHHRRAKIVDTVHAGLKTIFVLPPKFPMSLSQLSTDFGEQFSHPAIPPLPRILSMISSSISKQTDNHFFASVVRSKELIPMYHDVVLWMLKRDMLITLHLRIRIVATRELKIRVWHTRQTTLARRAKLKALQQRRGIEQRDELELGGLEELGPSTKTPSGIAWLSLSPKSARRHSRRLSSNESCRSEMSELIIREDDEIIGYANDADDAYDFGSSSDAEVSGSDSPEDHLLSSMITDPGRATPIQRRWLSAMSEGKDPHIAKRFELINQYFDGKESDDEILFRAEISRRQLREVLHHYDEYLQTFLHPS